MDKSGEEATRLLPRPAALNVAAVSKEWAIGIKNDLYAI